MTEHDNIVVTDDIRTATDPALDGYLLHAWCPEGRCRMRYNGREMLFSAGDCMIMVRRAGRLRDLQPEPGFKVEIVYVKQEFIGLATPMSNYGARGGLALFNDPVMHLTPDQQRVCAINFDYIRARLALPHHHFHRDAMLNAVQCMIIDFFDFHAELYGNVRLGSPQAQLLERFQAMLDRGDFRRYREVQHYASELCVTPKYLSEVSRKVSGLSASEWITRYTVLEIGRTLRNPALTLEEVSDLFSFSSVSYFIRYVQKHLGVSPSDLRR